MAPTTERNGYGAQQESIGRVSPDEVRAQLRRILDSDIFLSARRPSSFLRFVVESSLAGEADGIKEYLIGVEVFERPAQYDPRVDPVVRIEAGRLRKKLDEYYEGPGEQDPIVIGLPKGAYVPDIRRRTALNGTAGRAEWTGTIAEGKAAAGAGSATSRGNKRPWLIPVAAGLLLVVGLVSILLYRRAGRTVLKSDDTIVVADFANSTGEPVFDQTLRTAVLHSLAQSPFLNILPDGRIESTLRLMTRPLDSPLVPQVVREICLRTGSRAYITGSIARRSRYVFDIQAIDCQSGDKLGDQRVTVGARDQLLDAVGRAASRLRRQLGETLPSLRKFDTPLPEATTSSLEALNAYSLGMLAHRTLVIGASLPYALRAIDLDPNFALAYNAAANDYASMGEMAQAKEFFTRAFQLRQHASERERLKITADYYREVTGELDQAAEVFQQEIETYPHDGAAYGNLGIVYAEEGEYQKSLDITRRSLPTAPQNYPNMANRLLALGRLDETRQALQTMRKHGSLNFVARNLQYGLAFLSSDSAAMAQQQQWFAARPPYSNFGLALASDTEAYFGHLHKARDLTQEAVAAAVRAKDKESGAVWEAIGAQREAAYGDADRARRMAQEALKLAPTSSAAESEAAVALALAGDAAHARALAGDLENRFPLDTQIQAVWLPTINAQLALDGGDAASALSTLGTASRIEIGEIPYLLNFSCLYPAYVRGEAYLKAGQGSAAALEFQRILDHGGIVWNCWTGLLAHLGLARANALQSRTFQGAEARAARDRALADYSQFLNLWKDADPDMPLLKQAKEEYRRLH